jgi:hypothetical protein
MTRFGIAAALLVTACLSISAPASTKPMSASNIDADIDVTDGFGPAVVSYHLRGRVLTKVARLSDDSRPVGVSRATLAPADPLPDGLAKLAESAGGSALTPDSPTATIVIRRAAGERRTVLGLPLLDVEAARAFAALEAAPVAPAVTLEIALLPFAGAHETNGTRPVTLRMTVKGISGAEVRVPTADLAIEMTDVHPEVPGVTPLPPTWVAVSQPAAGPAMRVVKTGAPVEVSLRAPIPSAGAFALRAALDGTVTFAAPGLAEDARISTSSNAVTAPAAGPNPGGSGGSK